MLIQAIADASGLHLRHFAVLRRNRFHAALEDAQPAYDRHIYLLDEVAQPDELKALEPQPRLRLWAMRRPSKARPHCECKIGKARALLYVKRARMNLCRPAKSSVPRSPPK